MRDPVEVLCEQHRRMFKLLELLEHEVDRFRRGLAFDLYVVEGALDYMALYPDRLHRPLELAVYESMARHEEGSESVAGAAVEAEHALLSSQCNELRHAIVAVARRSSPPEDWLVDKANRLINGLREHMAKEETDVFPIARRTLTAQDIRAIEEALERDPEAPRLQEEEEAFKALYRTIITQQEIGLTR